MYNQVWLDKAGIKAPATLDEFVEMLRYFKDNDMNGNGDTSDEIPMSIMGEFLPYMFGPAFGLDLVSGFQADESGNVTYAYADSENYKKYLEFLNGLYKEGLLEKDYAALDRDGVIKRIRLQLGDVHDVLQCTALLRWNRGDGICRSRSALGREQRLLCGKKFSCRNVRCEHEIFPDRAGC